MDKMRSSKIFFILLWGAPASLLYPMKYLSLAEQWYAACLEQPVSQQDWQDTDKKTIRSPHVDYQVKQKKTNLGRLENCFCVFKNGQKKHVFKSSGYHQSFNKFALSILGTYAILQVNEKQWINSLIVCDTNKENTGHKIDCVREYASDVQAVACTESEKYAACIIDGKNRGHWQDGVFINNPRVENESLLLLVNLKKNQAYELALPNTSVQKGSLLFDKIEKNIAFKTLPSQTYKAYSLKKIKTQSFSHEHEETHYNIWGISIY